MEVTVEKKTGLDWEQEEEQEEQPQALWNSFAQSQEMQLELAKYFQEDGWWCVEFNFAGESIVIYRPTLRDLMDLVGADGSWFAGRYIVKEREFLDETDVYLRLGQPWAGSDGLGADEQKLVALARAAEALGEWLEDSRWEVCLEESENKDKWSGREENKEKLKRADEHKEKVQGMVEMTVRQIVRWMR